MATAPNNVEKLSYRELGERLGISPDGATMKAKRKAKEGAWRIVPGNHPSDRVVAEIPANDLGVRDRRRGTVHPENKPEQSPNIVERVLDELASARARNDDLTDKVIAAKDVLSTAYDKLISLNQELVSARIDLIAAKDGIAPKARAADATAARMPFAMTGA